MNDEAQQEFRDVQAYFRLPSVGLVEKDVHVVRAIRAVISIDAAPFALIFGGGTALARAHKLVRGGGDRLSLPLLHEDCHLVARADAGATATSRVSRRKLKSLSFCSIHIS